MKIQTMSIVCGTTECNAHCPFCVSSTTPSMGVNSRCTVINKRNLNIACRIAEKGGATTCLITGKGEPTLYPDLITEYIANVKDYFPLIELQTNGMLIGTPRLTRHLEDWYKGGLTTISLSAVETGYANKKIYGDDYPELFKTIKTVHDHGLSVRLSIMLMKKYIDSPTQLKRLIGFCKKNKVEQLTVRPIARPDNNDNAVTRYIEDHTLKGEMWAIKEHIEEHATPILHLNHGAIVYDYEGQNICLSNCLTTNDSIDDMRQIVYFPDGTIGYSWQYKGAILL